jgi:VanZ family protein
MRWKDASFTLGYCLVIWWLSSRSHVPKLGVDIPNLDKFVHAVLYAGLAATVYRGLRNAGSPPSRNMLLYAPLAFVAAYGIIDELHQSFVPLRTCSFADLVADVTGATLFQIAAFHPVGARILGRILHLRPLQD